MNLGLNTMAGKMIASVAVLGSAAAVAGLGTFGTFTSSTTASEQVSAGTVAIALGTAGSATNRLSVAAGGVVPGDTIQRAVDLTNGGTQSLSGIVLTTAATSTSVLDTNTTMGLQLKIDSCPAGWTESGTSPVFTYTCASPTTVLASTPVIQTNTSLPGLAALTPGGTDHLRVTLTLPAAADNTFQAASSTINFNLVGTQRAATSK